MTNSIYLFANNEYQNIHTHTHTTDGMKHSFALFIWMNIINYTAGLNIQHPAEKSGNPLDDEMRDSKANVDG